MQQSPQATGGKRKTTMFKEILKSKELDFMMEAHSGLSARIVQEAGFKCIWAGGLAISTQLGVRDCNEASWTQVLEICEFMADATDIPILFDADTGFGNFNNARRMVRKLEKIGIAACCIEDKPFPKTNSLDGQKQPLADMEEFALKIKACKDAQTDPDFCVIARCEALVDGYPMSEALRRAEGYDDAGADAIFMHSKKTGPEEIVEFMKVWKRKTPIVACPTKYFKTPTQQFRDLGISLVIWANYNIRASVLAMEQISQQAWKDKHVLNIVDKIAPIPELFRLQRDDELIAAEKKYLPRK
jgi:phosphoenolpyruvate phosphomutase